MKQSDPTEYFPLQFTSQTVALPAPLGFWAAQFALFKYICDKGSAVLCLPYIFCVGLVLLVLNPFFNPGPLFFTQHRMGLGGRRFRMWKFRTMSVAHVQARAHDAPLEMERITVFARYVRKLRLDELPNFFNVLVGDMSLVGPRPDAWDHATKYATSISYYSDRFRVRPGITGLAQVKGGYADTTRAVQRKAQFDRFYVRNSDIKLDVYIMLRTVLVFFTGFGAK